MCFSATASFITAAATGVVGAFALTRASRPRELPLAAMPLVFAFQQAVEGALWLELPVAPEAPIATTLTLVFLLFAQVFWPIYAPVAVMLVEPGRKRRTLLLLCLAAGISIALYLFSSLLAQSQTAVVRNGHIVYAAEYRHSDLVFLIYLAATSLPFMLSSRRMILAVGFVIAAGSIASYVFYWEAFVSVWCFFAAAASVLLLWHFERLRKHHLRAARA